MGDDVKKHLLARHRPCVAIREPEGDALAQYLILALGHVRLEPGIGLGNCELQLTQFWCGVSIRSCVSMLFEVGLQLELLIHNATTCAKPSRFFLLGEFRKQGGAEY